MCNSCKYETKFSTRNCLQRRQFILLLNFLRGIVYSVASSFLSLNQSKLLVPRMLSFPLCPVYMVPSNTDVLVSRTFPRIRLQSDKGEIYGKWFPLSLPFSFPVHFPRIRL
uniref:Uncharacterized protein n=1 Tax=Cacopsylla melanoneura TaxID=428564 RepID=A0A8D8TA24_9HEMI